MIPKAARVAIALVLATLLVMGAPADAQGTTRRTSRISRNPGGGGSPGNSPPGPPGPPGPQGVPRGTSPAIVIRCFVPNCGKCNNFNPYLCAQCNVGYQLTGAFACNSCAPGYEQNLEVQTFTCSACPPGTTSPGGTGGASQCVLITATAGRRLFEADDENLWA
jgi:hypothetical protein